jgi:hypothetical protein
LISLVTPSLVLRARFGLPAAVKNTGQQCMTRIPSALRSGDPIEYIFNLAMRPYPEMALISYSHWAINFRCISYVPQVQLLLDTT